MVAKEYGVAEIKWKDKIYKLNVLYVPKLGVSLLSARKFYKDHSAAGAFDDEKMYFHKDKKIILSADNYYGIYVISDTDEDIPDTAFPATEEELPIDVNDIVYDEVKPDQAEVQRKNRANRY